MTRFDLRGLVGAFALTFAAAAIGARASAGASEFYASLVRPAWAPPASVFGPVWTVLYIGIALAGFRVWRSRMAPSHGPALVLFITQLVLNALWSVLFFGLHQGALAFADIVLLLLTIAATTMLFWRIDRLAGALFVPYLAWVAFAAALNFTVWRANPGAL